ncbi:MAG: response regulator [Anaerolineae bacterium]|jgi:DNA-binding response OmpR family regulator|nr:response regulator [Anaerolineae bacterium]
MSKQPHAIVVEDDLFLSEIYSDTLRSIGIQVETIYDGESAMQRLKSATPDLIILDLNLPVYSGIEIFHELRKRTETSETWVLIVTANPAQAAELSESELNSQNLLVLAKPISVDQLDQLAQRLVFRK